MRMEMESRDSGEQLREMAEKVFQLLERLKLAELAKNKAMEVTRSMKSSAGFVVSIQCFFSSLKNMIVLYVECSGGIIIVHRFLCFCCVLCRHRSPKTCNPYKSERVGFSLSNSIVGISPSPISHTPLPKTKRRRLLLAFIYFAGVAPQRPGTRRYEAEKFSPDQGEHQRGKISREGRKKRRLKRSLVVTATKLTTFYSEIFSIWQQRFPPQHLLNLYSVLHDR